MKPLHYKKHTPARRFLSLLCILALCLGLLPVTALAAGNDSPHSLYVGNTNFASTIYPDNAAYWTSSDGGTNWTSQLEKPTGDSYIHYNGQDTLTLHNANIQGQYDSSNRYSGYGIYAVGAPNSAVSLTIQLEGTNTVSGWSGIFVHAVDGAASLSISGTGSLATEGTGGISFSGIVVQGNGGKAELTINNVDVTATNTSDYAQGILLQSADSSPATLTVNGGELTASGQRAGIKYVFGSSGTGGGTPTVTVSNNAIVRANGGISDDSSTDIQIGADSNASSGGIIFDGKNGTVYGNVTLQEDLTIGAGESLTIGQDANLTVPSGKTLTNNGTVTTTGSGTLTNSGTINNSGTLTGSITNAPPKITTTSLPNGEVDTTYNQPLGATGSETITWSLASGSTMPAGLTLNSDGTITGTPTTAGQFTFTATATNSAGSDSEEYTLTIKAVSVTDVSLDKDTLSLYTGDTASLTATVEPDNATNKNVTWSSDNADVATVDNGTVTAVSAGTATITVTTEDGQKTAACTVTVTDKTYMISADATALNFGSAYTGYAQPAAQTVTLTNTGNQPVTLTQPASTNSFEVGILSQTALAAGDTATFTVQPKAGLSAGTYSDTITVSGTNNATSSIIASFTVKSQPPTIPPTVSEKTIDAIQDAEPGETVTVDLSHGSTKLDKEVFETLAGQDITLDIDLGDGLSWTVNGSDIPEDATLTDIDMGVTMNSDGIPVDVVNAITGEHGSVQLELAHDGAFGFTMTLAAPLGEENAGYWANLYYFNESTNKMTFETAAKINSDGTASLSFSHASQYAIVIDDHNHGVVELPFTDVSEGDWFYDPVCFVYSQGLMTGTSATTFEPNTSLSRAMLVAVLHRLEGSPQASAGDFIDVADSDWYAQAVNWAASVGVVNGFDDGTFQPNAAITREQLAAVLRNYAAYKGLDVSASGSLSTFTDAASVSDWAKESVEWAVGSGLIGGYEDSTLQPQGTTTRAEVASVLQRALGNVAGNQ